MKVISMTFVDHIIKHQFFILQKNPFRTLTIFSKFGMWYRIIPNGFPKWIPMDKFMIFYTQISTKKASMTKKILFCANWHLCLIKLKFLPTNLIKAALKIQQKSTKSQQHKKCIRFGFCSKYLILQFFDLYCLFFLLDALLLNWFINGLKIEH